MNLKGLSFSYFFNHDILVFSCKNCHHTYFIYFLAFAQEIRILPDASLPIILKVSPHSLMIFIVFSDLEAYANCCGLLLVSKCIHFNLFYGRFRLAFQFLFLISLRLFSILMLAFLFL